MFLQQYERRSRLKNLSISAENVDNARRLCESAASSYQQANRLSRARGAEPKRTEVRASVNRFVSNLNLAKGDFASPARPVLALVDSDSYWVDAYFEETKIAQIRAGSPVDIHLMNGAAVLRGSVESIAQGITDQDNHDGAELLASVNPTFTWVRLHNGFRSASHR